MEPSEAYLSPHRAFARLEYVYVIATLMLLLEAVLVPLRSAALQDDFNSNSGDRPLQIMWLVLNTIATCLLLKRWRHSLPMMRSSALVWLLVGFAFMSTLWSSAPDVSTRRGVALVLSTLFGIYFASSFSLRQQVSLLAAALSISAVISLIFVLVLPSTGIDAGGQWQGAFITKNTLGQAMTMAITTLLLGPWQAARVSRLMRTVLLVCAIVMLIGAGSSTALVVLPLLILSRQSAKVLRWPLALSVPILVIGLSLWAAAASWITDNTAEAFGILGRDPSLTGRTELWGAVIHQIENRPLIGYGFGGFWLGLSGPSADIWNALTWLPPHAHNGILDLWLDLGLVGVLLFVAGFVLALGRAVLLVRRSQELISVWPLTFLVFMLLYNISESLVLQQNSIYWVMYVSVFASLASRGRGDVEPNATLHSAACPATDEGARSPLAVS